MSVVPEKQTISAGFEKRKVAIDFYKHLATLSVACIAYIASFYSGGSESIENQQLLAHAVIYFSICTVSTTVLCLFLITVIENIVRAHGTYKIALFRIMSVASFFSFLIGVWKLAWFVVMNS